MQNYYLLIISILCFSATSIVAQENPYRWGKIDTLDLTMQQYEDDIEADAVVLFDIGSVSIDLNRGNRYTLRHHRRFKVLNEAPQELTNVSIPFYTAEEEAEKITNVKAYILKPDGSKILLPRKRFVTNKIDNEWSSLDFSFPEAEKGSIVEYRYELTSIRIEKLRPWYFQYKYPVRYSQLLVSIPELLKYDFLFTDPMGIIKRSQTSEPFVLEGVEPGQLIENDETISIIRDKLVAEKIPAVQHNPFMTSQLDHRTSVRFFLRKVTFPGGEVDTVMVKSWDNIASDLLTSDQFGLQFRDGQYHTEITKQVKAYVDSGQSESEKVRDAYRFLNDKVKWSGVFTPFVRPATTLDGLFAAGEAHSGELNLILLTMLQGLDIEAYPVLISTRTHGTPVQRYPVLNQFDHTLVVAQIDGHYMILDAGSKFRPAGIPRVASLNQYGLSVKDKPEWIPIEPLRSSEITVAKATIDETANIKTEMDLKYINYAAIDQREAYASDMVQQNWSKELANNFDQVDVSKMKITNSEVINQPLKEQFEFTGQLKKNKDGLYSFLPVLSSDYRWDMLADSKAPFPVSLPYPVKEQFVIRITIPEGFEVVQLPASTRVMIRNEGGDFNFVTKQSGNTINLISRIHIYQLRYQTQEYDNIKEFFEHITEKLTEPILLKKIEKG